MEEIFRKMAIEKGEYYQGVYAEMQKAICLAMEKGDAEFWSRIPHIGEKPTPQEVVLYLINILVNG